MEYLHITKENIDKEHIACALSGPKSKQKKAWMKARFEEGLVFYRSVAQGKCFIEYIPAAHAWVPIHGPGYLFINCLWVSGALKGHGYSRDLLDECLKDAKAQGMQGLCILSSEGKKRSFLADPDYLAYQGFKIADTSTCGITLMYLPLSPSAEPPRFKECAKDPRIEEKGFVLYYTDQCPFTSYWVPRIVEVAQEARIPLQVIHLTDRESARSAPSPVTTYALFRDGKFLTQTIQTDKTFLALARKGKT